MGKGIIVMNPKETVFTSRDLLHSIMDFLPDAEPIWARVVSVSWAIGMCGYKLPNMLFDHREKGYDEFCHRTTLIPSYIWLYPKREKYSLHSVQKILFSSLTNDLINLSPDDFAGYPNLFDLEISFLSVPLNLCNFPASLKRLKIKDYGNPYKTHIFDGSNLLNLVSLDLAKLDHISFPSILPPNYLCLEDAIHFRLRTHFQVA
jgi:hypothetical protein